MMIKFLEAHTNYDDIPVKLSPGLYGLTVLCPKCSGHGTYNLELNAYGPGKHFQGGCRQCNGWGWVRPEDSVCVHDWKQTAHDQWRCLTNYKCAKCGVEQTVDSSG